MATHSRFISKLFSKLALFAVALALNVSSYASPSLQPTPEKHFYSASNLISSLIISLNGTVNLSSKRNITTKDYL